MVKLYNWQKTAYDKWNKNDRRGICKAVPGSGKTEVGGQIIREVLKEHKKAKILILCPSHTIIRQWQQYIRYNELDNFDIKVETYFRAVGDKELYDLIVYDECHSLLSPKRSKVLRIKTKYQLGLSATPLESEDLLGKIFIDVKWEEANIAPFEVVFHKFPLTNKQAKKYARLSQSVTIAMRKYEDGRITHEQMMGTIMYRRSFVYKLNQRIQITMNLLYEHMDRRIILFAERLSQIKKLQERLNEEGVPYSVYTSDEDTIDEYIRGETNILLSSKMVKEGFNDPATDIGILVSTPLSERNHIQTIGRIVRYQPDKEARIYVILAKNTTDETLGEKKVRFGRKYSMDVRGRIFMKVAGKSIFANPNGNTRLYEILRGHSGRFFVNENGEVRVYKNNMWCVIGIYVGSFPEFPKYTDQKWSE